MRDDDKEAVDILVESIALHDASEVELQHFFVIKNRNAVKGLVTELGSIGYKVIQQSQGLFQPTVVIATHIVSAINISNALTDEIVNCEKVAQKFGAVHDGWEGGPILPRQVTCTESASPHHY